MLPRLALALLFAAVGGVSACSRKPIPTDLPPAKDQAELQSRYDAIWVGMGTSDVAALMGKEGAQSTDFSSQVIKRKPKGSALIPGLADFELFWASDDSTSAIRVVFGSDDRARLIQLLELKPKEPPPGR